MTNYNKTIVMSTFPRCGSNFVKSYLEETTDIKIIKTHRIVIDDRDIFTIVRDPFDSIASFLTMESINGYDWFSDKMRCEERIENYEFFYKYILKHINFIINFDNLDNKIEQISDLLCKNFGVKQIKSIDEVNKFEWFKKTTKIKSNITLTSTNSQYYDLARESLKKYDLSKCYELYNQAISKTII